MVQILEEVNDSENNKKDVKHSDNYKEDLENLIEKMA